MRAMCDAWVGEFERRLAAPPEVFDPGLVRAGVEVWRALAGSAEREVLLLPICTLATSWPRAGSRGW